MFFKSAHESATPLEGRSSDFPFGAPGQPSKELNAPLADGPTALYDLWRSKAGTGGVPRKSDFNPKEMTRYISCVYLIDFLAEASDFQVRLFGTDVADMLGKDYTGVLLSETPADINWRGEIYELAFRRREPVFYLFNLGSYGREYIETENALFPLLDGDGKLAHLLCISVRTSQK